MTAKRKSRRSRAAARLPAPTEGQIVEALLAFERIKLRYRLESLPDAPPTMRYIVRVLPEMMVGDAEFMGVKGLPPVSKAVPGAREAAYTIHRFADEASARRWREHEIIRETITAGMRAKP